VEDGYIFLYYTIFTHFFLSVLVYDFVGCYLFLEWRTDIRNPVVPGKMLVITVID
jgi:hypothetical protein